MIFHSQHDRLRAIFLGALFLLELGTYLPAAGIYEDGASARAQALAGASVAGSDHVLDGLLNNPAELTQLRGPQLDLGLSGVLARGSYQPSTGDSAEMEETGAKPKLALSYPLGPFTLAAGFNPDAALRADWQYRDRPGGLDGATTYGTRTHRSELTLLRFALSAGYRVTPQLSVGATLGLLYNRNRLHAPYTLQTQPQLKGAKVLLDLDTEGWGDNATFGATWDPLASLQLGLSYTLASRIRATGRAKTDAGRQLRNLGLATADATADFDAEVTNTFPQIASMALAWKALPRWTLLGQIDWIDWQEAFDTLDVRLRHVDNADYRGLLANKSNLDDDVPLRWRDQWVARAGVEYALDEHWLVRAGYRYGRDPVPNDTVTPLTAVLGEHVVSTGLGFQTERFGVDLTWQWQLPDTAHVQKSALLGGEYSGSKVDLQVHTLSLMTTVRF